MRSLFARGLVAALTLGTLAVSQVANAQTASPTPAILFGNTDLSSRNLLLGGTVSTTTSTTSHESLAQGFTVGDVSYQIQSVDLGLYMSADMPTLKVDLYSSVGEDGDEIPSVILGSFDATAPTNNGGVFTPGGILVYNFAYTGDTVLEAGEKYWIVVTYDKTTTNREPAVFNWHYAATGPDGGAGSTALPGQLTGSGITYLGTLGTHDAGGQWLDHRLGTTFPHAGLRIGIWGFEPVVGPGGDGGEQAPPTLNCYAYDKDFFKNNYPAGWPASVIVQGGTLIGENPYSVTQLRTMLAASGDRSNRIGQLASQLVAVHLSRELARQSAGANYALWDGWAPESTEAQAAYQQAAELINASLGFDRRGRITGCVTGVSNLVTALEDYVDDNKCSTSSPGCGNGHGGNGHGGNGHGGNCRDDDDRRCDGRYRGKCQGRDRQGRKCGR